MAKLLKHARGQASMSLEAVDPNKEERDRGFPAVADASITIVSVLGPIARKDPELPSTTVCFRAQ